MLGDKMNKPKMPVKPGIKQVSKEPPKQPKIRYKSYVVIESGFHCGSCGFETVTFDGSSPARCVQCNSPYPTIMWKNRITNNLKVETLPLK